MRNQVKESGMTEKVAISVLNSKSIDRDGCHEKGTANFLAGDCFKLLRNNALRYDG